jgi:hypothetical protein
MERRIGARAVGHRRAGEPLLPELAKTLRFFQNHSTIVPGGFDVTS